MSPPPPGGSESGDDRSRSASFEIQFHPAGAHGRIRYLRISLGELRAVGALVGLVVAFLVLGAALAPLSIRSALGGDRRAAARGAHAQLARELRTVVAGLGSLEPRSLELLLAAQRFAVVYDLDVASPSLSVEERGAEESVEGEPVGSLRRRGRSLSRRLGQEASSVALVLDAAQTFQRVNPARVASTPSITPLATGQYVVTSPFGERLNPFTRERETHAGLDLAAAVGTPVRATADGVVLFAGLLGEGASTSSGWFRYGKLCIVEHDAGFVTLYGHLDEVRVAAGRRLRRSEVLGAVGNTGWTTHPHLHYEVRRRRNGELRPADPRAFFLGIPKVDGDRMPGAADLSKVLGRGFEPLPDLSTSRRSP